MPGTLTISKISDGTTTGSATDMIKGSAKAWVNFNGVTTTSIRASYNVSSVTRNASGDYTINFTTALADANYAPTMSCSIADGTSSAVDTTASFKRNNTAFSTSAFRFVTAYNNSGVPTLIDSAIVTVAVFGN